MTNFRYISFVFASLLFLSPSLTAQTKNMPPLYGAKQMAGDNVALQPACTAAQQSKNGKCVAKPLKVQKSMSGKNVSPAIISRPLTVQHACINARTQQLKIKNIKSIPGRKGQLNLEIIGRVAVSKQGGGQIRPSPQPLKVTLTRQDKGASKVIASTAINASALKSLEFSVKTSVTTSQAGYPDFTLRITGPVKSLDCFNNDNVKMLTAKKVQTAVKQYLSKQKDYAPTAIKMGLAPVTLQSKTPGNKASQAKPAAQPSTAKVAIFGTVKNPQSLQNQGQISSKVPSSEKMQQARASTIKQPIRNPHTPTQVQFDTPANLGKAPSFDNRLIGKAPVSPSRGAGVQLLGGEATGLRLYSANYNSGADQLNFTYQYTGADFGPPVYELWFMGFENTLDRVENRPRKVQVGASHSIGESAGRKRGYILFRAPQALIAASDYPAVYELRSGSETASFKIYPQRWRTSNLGVANLHMIDNGSNTGKLSFRVVAEESSSLALNRREFRYEITTEGRTAAPGSGESVVQRTGGKWATDIVTDWRVPNDGQYHRLRVTIYRGRGTQADGSAWLQARLPQGTLGGYTGTGFVTNLEENRKGDLYLSRIRLVTATGQLHIYSGIRQAPGFALPPYRPVPFRYSVIVDGALVENENYHDREIGGLEAMRGNANFKTAYRLPNDGQTHLVEVRLTNYPDIDAGNNVKIQRISRGGGSPKSGLVSISEERGQGSWAIYNVQYKFNPEGDVSGTLSMDGVNVEGGVRSSVSCRKAAGAATGGSEGVIPLSRAEGQRTARFMCEGNSSPSTESGAGRLYSTMEVRLDITYAGRGPIRDTMRIEKRWSSRVGRSSTALDNHFAFLAVSRLQPGFRISIENRGGVSSAATSIQYTVFSHETDESCGNVRNTWTPAQGLKVKRNWPRPREDLFRDAERVLGPSQVNIPVIRPREELNIQLTGLSGYSLSTSSTSNACLVVQFDPREQIDTAPNASLPAVKVYEINM